MTNKIKGLIRLKAGEIRSAENEVQKYLSRIKDYATKALETPTDNNKAPDVEQIENCVKHLTEEQTKLDSLRETQAWLEWILEKQDKDEEGD